MNPEASLIVSVYKSLQDLRSILFAASKQSFKNFEVIISEDGDSEGITQVLSSQPFINPSQILHLSQPDLGFRKNRALNRAVMAARSPYLIFIDGDCVPGPRFIESHLRSRSPLRVAAGRRVELGPRWSAAIRSKPHTLEKIAGNLRYFLSAPSLLLDNVKNYESGIESWLLQRAHPEAELDIVGCNFSCEKATIEKVNGFDEDYKDPGLGEDTDLQWRFEEIGIRTKNIKFLAPLFHLHHSLAYGFSQRNRELYIQKKQERLFFCRNGISSIK